MSSRRSASMGGRPGGRRERQRQRRRRAARCQRMTVSGCTSRTASLKRRKRPANAPRSHRSNRRHRGRLTWRRTTMSCWRRIRFSATRAVRGTTKARCRTGSEGGRSRQRALTRAASSWQGAELAPRWPRHGRRTGSDSAHVRSICAPHDAATGEIVTDKLRVTAPEARRAGTRGATIGPRGKRLGGRNQRARGRHSSSARRARR